MNEFSSIDELRGEYWIEFLQWVKKYNQEIEAKNKAAMTGHYYEKDATEINFWHWYIDTKLDKEETS